jgi:hypothetical protein
VAPTQVNGDTVLGVDLEALAGQSVKGFVRKVVESCDRGHGEFQDTTDTTDFGSEPVEHVDIVGGGVEHIHFHKSVAVEKKKKKVRETTPKKKKVKIDDRIAKL